MYWMVWCLCFLYAAMVNEFLGEWILRNLFVFGAIVVAIAGVICNAPMI